MSEKQVKGSIMLDYVRMIRANRDKDWQKYLEPEDWEIVNGRILPSVWYPFDTFQRCGLAAFHLIANGNVDLVQAWGRISMEQLVKGIYKSMIADPVPSKALDRFILMRRQFFNFSVLELEQVSEKQAEIWLFRDPDDPGTEPYSAQLKGGFERLIELAGGHNPKITFFPTERDGKKCNEFDITWE